MEFGWNTDQRNAFESTLEWARQCLSDDRPEPGEKVYRAAWRKLGGRGLLGLSVPERLGGSGLGALDTATRIEAFGQGCPDTGLVFAAAAQLFACAMPIAESGSESVRRRLLPRMCAGDLIAGNAMTESAAGSDVAQLAVSAVAVAGGFELNGEKSFVTNGPVADVLVTYAATDPGAGYLGVTAFVVECDSAGVVIGESFEKMGLNSALAGSVRFDRCFVPAEHVLGVPGAGSAIFQHSMRWERACLFAAYLGLLERLQDQCVAHARTRRQFGRRIGSFPAVAHRIANMKLRLESARLLLYRACWKLDGISDADLAGNADMAIALSKLSISESAVANAMDAIEVFGGDGYRTDKGIEKVLRDAVPSTIFSGTSDIQRTLVAKGLGL